jgi:hypothetical protein
VTRYTNPTLPRYLLFSSTLHRSVQKVWGINGENKSVLQRRFGLTLSPMESLASCIARHSLRRPQGATRADARRNAPAFSSTDPSQRKARYRMLWREWRRTPARFLQNKSGGGGGRGTAFRENEDHDSAVWELRGSRFGVGISSECLAAFGGRMGSLAGGGRGRRFRENNHPTRRG